MAGQRLRRNILCYIVDLGTLLMSPSSVTNVWKRFYQRAPGVMSPALAQGFVHPTGNGTATPLDPSSFTLYIRALFI